MSLSFIFPLALWALLLLPLFWLFSWLTRSVHLMRLGQTRYLFFILLRSLMLAALIFALAGTQIVRAVDRTAVVFLIDGSDSLAPALREQAIEYVNAALTTGDEEDQAAVVVFGADAAVERAPGPLVPISRLGSVVIGSRTDIGDAIQLGLALLPADAQKRIVLLSDGGENEGSSTEAARLASLRDIPIEVVPLQGERGADVLLEALVVPPSAREGQEIPLTIRVQSSVAGPAQIDIFADGQLVAAQDVQLSAGQNSFTVNIPAGESGFRRFEARIEAAADTQPLNNRAATFSQIDGPPRILLVASAADRAAPLQQALQAAGMNIDLLLPSQIPTSQSLLRNYAAIVAVDVLASSMPNQVQEAVVTYVRDQGGGFAMIGGTESFGAGGWRRTPIAELLPVELDPPAKDERPDLALALVIDRSGSMSDITAGGQTKLALAKEAVYQASLGLAQNDQIGVIAFDDSAQTVLPMQQLPDIAGIEDALSRVSEGGGTNIRSGIEQAAQTLANTDARVKHVILLTDGFADSNYSDLIREMRDNNVTITIVAMGSDANPTLEAIASLGGGAFYSVLAPADVPSVFLAETVRAAQRDIIEEPFIPAITIPAAPVRDLGGLPPLYGYNAVDRRDSARTLLVSPDNTPILAVWQYGLGRSLAWTSDLKGQWARDWIGWEQFPRFAAGLVDTLRPAPSSDTLLLEARSDGPQALFDLTIQGSDGRPIEASSLQGVLLDPEGNSSQMVFSQVNAGRYRAVTPVDQPGVYLSQVVVLGADGQPIGTASGGLVVSYSPEYGVQSADNSLLEQLAVQSGGQIRQEPLGLFETAGQRVGQVREIALPLLWLVLLLLPLDIGLRRIFLRWSEIRGSLPSRPRATQPAQAGSDPLFERLQAARARTRRAVAPAPPATPPEQQPKPVSRVRPQTEPPSKVAPTPPATPPQATKPEAPPAPPSPESQLDGLLAAKRRRQK